MVKSVGVCVLFVIACVLIMAEVKPTKSDEDEAEDNMLERAINKPVLKVMLNVDDKEDPDIPQGAGPVPFLKECPAEESPRRYLPINDKIRTCWNINCQHTCGYKQLQMIKYCSGDDLASSRVADLALREMDMKAPGFVGPREIHEDKITLKKNMQNRAQAVA